MDHSGPSNKTKLKKGRNTLRRAGVGNNSLPRVVDRTAENSNTNNKILVLTRTNLSPIPASSRKTFHFNSFFKMACPQYQNNYTVYWSTTSLYDPDVTNVGSNKAVPFFPEVFGTTSGLYRSFRVHYVDIKVRVINNTAGTFPMIVLHANTNGSASFPTTAYIHNIAGYPMSTSAVLEYVGDTAWRTFTFRIHPWEVLGITKQVWDDDTRYLYAYNVTAGQSPWLCISLGDAVAVTGNGDAQSVTGEISIDYHVTAYDPALLTAA